jgi:phosphoglycerate dehydrogenase-like enzyme
MLSSMSDPASAALALSGPQLVFALSPKELGVFFGREDLPLAGVNFTGARADFPAFLEEMQPEVLVTCWSSPAIPESWLRDPACPLKYLCHLTGSVRGILPRVFLERGGLVTNWGGLAAPQVAEHALLLALAALRALPEWRPSNWNCKFATRTLYNKKVGFHGFGQVARHLRELLRPFNVEVSAYSQGVPAEFIESHDVTPRASLEELFADSEVLFEVEALNEQTARSVTGKVLAALPDGAVFVNVGRGAVVEESALIAEAQTGRLSLALDVVTFEPLAADSPLATLPSVLYSPHVGGPTGDQFRRCGEQALANLDRFYGGAPLQAEVTLEIYDRAT